MFQCTLRSSARLIAIPVITLVGACGSLRAQQKPGSGAQRWSEVSPPAAGPDGTIYFSASAGDAHPLDQPPFWTGPGRNYLYALKPDGTQKWKFALENSEIDDRRFPPWIGPSGIVYVADNLYLYAVDSSGARKWKFPLTGAPFWLDFGTDGAIYFCADTAVSGRDRLNTVYALKADGALKWQKSTQAAPILGPDGTLYTTSGNLLYAIDAGGAAKWSSTLGKGPILALVSPQSKTASAWEAYVVGSDNPFALYAVAPNGAEKWKFPLTNPLYSLPLAPDGTIRLSEGNILHALNTDGTVKWNFDAPRDHSIYQAYVGPDGATYIESAVNGEVPSAVLYALKPDGTLKWQSQPWDDAAHRRGVLQVGGDGTVYVYEGINVRDGFVGAAVPYGTIKWSFGVTGLLSLKLGADGTIYAVQYVDYPPSAKPPTGTLSALTPAGQTKWRFDPADH